MIIKRKEVKAEWWLKEVRNMRCCVPDCTAFKSQPHHLLKMRWRDDLIIPLCARHHTFGKDSIHVLDELNFMKQHNFNIYEYLFKVMLPAYEQAKANRG